MFELTCGLVVLVVVIGALYAFRIARDPLHPAIFLAPLFGYFYGVWPVLLNSNEGLQEFFTPDILEYAGAIFFLSIAAMYVGLLYGALRLRRAPPANLNVFASALTPTMSRRLVYLALFMGCLSVAAFAVKLDGVGGLVAAYSRGKGGGHVDSGYISEAIMLSFPALLILAMGVYSAGRRIRLKYIIMALFIASPHLIHGILGGRRGPLFLILATLVFSWFLAKGKRPALKATLGALAAIVFTVLFVSSQRHNVYIGSEESIEFSRIYESDGLNLGDVRAGNSYVTAVANIVASDYYQDFYWGYRYFVTFLIRPIPRQIWPTKYEDMGATWLEVYEDRIPEVLGFVQPRGVSGGAISDGYAEFSWGVILLFLVVGRAFAVVYERHRIEGGFWSIILFIMLALSIYLPTQSFSAWMHRLLFMFVFGYIFWKQTIGPVSKPKIQRPIRVQPYSRRRLT